MSKFNAVKKSVKSLPNVLNKAGSPAYSQTEAIELASILLTSFAGDTYYRSGDATVARIEELIGSVDPLFVAKAALYARNECGMRSISHVVASKLAAYASGTEWATAFYDAIVRRLDDMTEIVAYHLSEGKKLTNAMKRGFSNAFGRFDEYAIAKYRSEGKSVTLVDVVNLVHPVPTKENKKALKALMAGKLKNEDTWESRLSKAGQSGSEDEKSEMKADAWKELLTEKKLGYFALLRNLRNIATQTDSETLDLALKALVDEKAISKSLVLPFRFKTAYAELSKLSLPSGSKILSAIGKAADISLKNIPALEGKTLIALDCSGSMSGRPSEIGSVFAAALVKAQNADLITFSDDAKYQTLNTNNDILTIADNIPFASGGTNFNSIFDKASEKYDNVFILSDMQAWIGGNVPTDSFNEWKRRTKSNPTVYSFDLAGLGTLQFPEKNVICLAGFSEKVFSMLNTLKKGGAAIIEEIEKISL